MRPKMLTVACVLVSWGCKMRFTLIGLTVLVYMLTGSAAVSQEKQTYAEQVAAIPPPTNERERQQKCAYLRSEMARQRNLAAVGGARMKPGWALAFSVAASSNIAALESRAADFNCSAPFGDRPTQSSIDSCIAACRQNTSRTPEACFDACNH